MLALCAAVVLHTADLSPGMALKQAQRLPEAERIVRAIVAAHPRDAEAAVQLATVVGWQGRHAEAEQLWLRAVAMRPADPEVRLGLARVRWWRGDGAGARRELDVVLAAHPQHGDALALRRQIATAERRLSWRGDLIAGRETYSAAFSDATTLGAALSVAWRGLGSLSAGVARRRFAEADETTWSAGLGVPLADGLSLSLSGERTWDPFVAARAALGVDVAWRSSQLIEPLAGWRRSWFAGDHVDLLRPGLRVYPLAGDWAESHVEARVLIARSPISDVNGGVALRLVAAHASGWSAGLGLASADEAEPPRAVTRVVTVSAGVAWNGPRWGVRLDYEHEDRSEEWSREGLALGLRTSW